jgi:hypothetical protein
MDQMTFFDRDSPASPDTLDIGQEFADCPTSNDPFSQRRGNMSATIDHQHWKLRPDWDGSRWCTLKSSVVIRWFSAPTSINSGEFRQGTLFCCTHEFGKALKGHIESNHWRSVNRRILVNHVILHDFRRRVFIMNATARSFSTRPWFLTISRPCQKWWLISTSEKMFHFLDWWKRLSSCIIAKTNQRLLKLRI